MALCIFGHHHLLFLLHLDLIEEPLHLHLVVPSVDFIESPRSVACPVEVAGSLPLGVLEHHALVQLEVALGEAVLLHLWVGAVLPQLVDVL